MVKKILLSCLLIILNYTSITNTAIHIVNDNANSTKKTKIIKLHSEDWLRISLEAIGLEHFVEKTQIHKKLGNKKLTLGGIIMQIDLAIHDYLSQLDLNPKQKQLMRMLRPQIIESILLWCSDEVRMEALKKSSFIRSSL